MTTNVARRKLGMSSDDTRAFLALVRSLLSVEPLTVEIHEAGMLLAEQLGSPLAAGALGIAVATPAAAQAHIVRMDAELPLDGSGQLQVPGNGPEAWHRIHWLPGLELMLSADASPIVLRAAQSIRAEYVGHAVHPFRKHWHSG